MTAFVIASVGLVGAVLFLWEKAARHDAEKRADTAELERDLAHQRLAAAADEATRFKSTINYLRNEAERLNHEVASCNLPGAARDRLQRLLARATSPDV